MLNNWIFYKSNLDFVKMLKTNIQYTILFWCMHINKFVKT